MTHTHTHSRYSCRSMFETLEVLWIAMLINTSKIINKTHAWSIQRDFCEIVLMSLCKVLIKYVLIFIVIKCKLLKILCYHKLKITFRRRPWSNSLFHLDGPCALSCRWLFEMTQIKRTKNGGRKGKSFKIKNGTYRPK